MHKHIANGRNQQSDESILTQKKYAGKKCK